MKKSYIFIFLMIALFFLTGCGNGSTLSSKGREENVKDAIAVVDNLELAKSILKPKKSDLDVSRDPFKPLVVKTTEKKVDAVIVPEVPDIDVMSIESMKYLGRVRSDDENAAFLKSNKDKGLYRVDDRIKDFVVREILDDKVIFSNGKREITLRRVE
jgi:hypothetical protein